VTRRRWGGAGQEPVAIGDSLRGVVSSLRGPEVHQGSSVLGGVFGRWAEAVGPAVAQHVQPIKLDGTRLTVEVDDPAWATQLRFFEQTMRDRLREVAGAVVETVDIRVRKR
jgi:predicted nucleic acid-binding Zn ribbon protein